MSQFLKYFKMHPDFETSLKSIHYQGIRPQECIYLDSAASTPIDLRVHEEMSIWALSVYANPSNRLHPLGELAEHALADARERLANLFLVPFEGVIFTSSATEANNLLLRGLVENPLRKRNKIVFAATEHSCIATTAIKLQENYSSVLGIEAEILKVDNLGQVDLKHAEKVIDKNTLCVCVMDVNNETGILQSHLPAIQKLAHQAGALLHVDSAQGFARAPQFLSGIDYDTAVISSSKIYGPKGAAALLVKKRKPKIRLEPQLVGGGQEFGYRSSTPNLAAIRGFVKACELQVLEAKERLEVYERLEKLFVENIRREIPAIFFGLEAPRAPGIIMMAIPQVNAMKLIEECRTLCLSAGSACKTLQATASHVLCALGIEETEALAGFRVSFGLMNTEVEVKMAVERIVQTAKRLQKDSATF